ncbi:carbohydrate ABC transporter permease [Youxingia wuxianensis]|uniref:Carbohydrate ABC transporter permease n=1 Tax=Youxingia wuxianensis TaxID=2763678 RepID=A0A926IH38_9FIRM|nr:carbohydrate ABC transporter permease [Youxingia wuxianensis]MBC8585509.1 carbohydrate ABC transporter permease [Youxingia wuxianensis]
MKREKRVTTFIYLLILIISAVAVVMPLYMTILNSFKPYPEIAADITAFPIDFTWNNYIEAWTRLDFANSFKNTLIIAIFSNVGSVVFASMLGYWIVRHPNKFTNSVYFLIIAGMAIPFQGIMITYAKMIGLLNMGNHLMGVIVSNWVFSTPMSMFLTAGAVKSVPYEIEESARIDGCGPLKVYWQIVFPLIKGTIFTVACLNIIDYWNNYLMTQFILTKKDMRTIQIAMQSLFNEAFFAWDVALGAVSLSILPLFIFFIIAQKQVLDGVTAGAVKG